MSEVNSLASQASDDAECREQLLTDYGGFILSCASAAIGHRVSRSDDEWSIALSAFNEAIDSYDNGKGNFLSHARLVIGRRLIDYQRRQYRRKEVSVPPEAFYDDEEVPIVYEVVETCGDIDLSLREELLRVNQVLDKYGFSFFDLAGKTPRKRQPRSECADGINGLIDEPPLLSWMRNKKRLPLSKLSEHTGARKKTLSFFRYFVITGAEILTREFPSLRHYFRFVRKGAR